jgi:hypothetical protein
MAGTAWFPTRRDLQPGGATINCVPQNTLLQLENSVPDQPTAEHY